MTHRTVEAHRTAIALGPRRFPVAASRSANHCKNCGPLGPEDVLTGPALCRITEKTVLPDGTVTDIFVEKPFLYALFKCARCNVVQSSLNWKLVDFSMRRAFGPEVSK